MTFSSSRTFPGQSYSQSCTCAASLRRTGPCGRRAFIFSRKCSIKKRDVGPAIAQRREADGDHLQAIEEVLAKAALADFVEQLLVGGGDDAHVGLEGPIGADRAELPLLQHAQQLDLQRRAHLGDFVEEDRPAARHLEHSMASADRAGERPSLVAEQLGLEQLCRNGTAVERDERAARSARSTRGCCGRRAPCRCRSRR